MELQQVIEENTFRREVIMRKIIFGLVVFYLVPLALFAQKTIQVEDMMNFVYPRNLKVSPEGNRFVFTVRTADFEKSRWVSRLWYFDSMSKIVVYKKPKK